MTNGDLSDSGSPADENDPTEYPDASELPDHQVSADDLDPFSEDPAEFDDVNEFAVAEWTESTTARQRIRDVAKRTASPKSAGDIADVAEVSVTAARNTLNDLVEEGIAHAEDTTNGRVYQRNPDWYLMQRVQRLATSEGLVDRIQSLQREVTEYQDRYGVDSPEEAVVSDDVLSEAELEDISHWRTAKRDLSFLRAAYRFREAKRATLETDTQRRDENSVTPS